MCCAFCSSTSHPASDSTWIDNTTCTRALCLAQPIRLNPRQRSLHAVFRTYIDVMHVQRDEQGRQFTLAAQRTAAAAAAAEEVCGCGLSDVFCVRPAPVALGNGQDDNLVIFAVGFCFRGRVQCMAGDQCLDMRSM